MNEFPHHNEMPQYVSGAIEGQEHDTILPVNAKEKLTPDERDLSWIGQNSQKGWNLLRELFAKELKTVNLSALEDEDPRLGNFLLEQANVLDAEYGKGYERGEDSKISAPAPDTQAETTTFLDNLRNEQNMAIEHFGNTKQLETLRRTEGVKRLRMARVALKGASILGKN